MVYEAAAGMKPAVQAFVRLVNSLNLDSFGKSYHTLKNSFYL